MRKSLLFGIVVFASLLFIAAPAMSCIDGECYGPQKGFEKADAHSSSSGFGQTGVNDEGAYVSNGGTVAATADAKSKINHPNSPTANANTSIYGNVQHDSHSWKNHAGSWADAQVDAHANSNTTAEKYGIVGWRTVRVPCWGHYHYYRRPIFGWKTAPAFGKQTLKIDGIAEQFNMAEVEAKKNEFNWASGYSLTTAEFEGSVKGCGFSAWLDGYANSHGYTELDVHTSKDGRTSTANGYTAGWSDAYVNGGVNGYLQNSKFKTNASGQGGVMTATFAEMPGAWTATFTDSNFQYNNNGGNHAQGSGWASGNGSSKVTKSGNGFTIRANSSASAHADSNNRRSFNSDN